MPLQQEIWQTVFIPHIFTHLTIQEHVCPSNSDSRPRIVSVGLAQPVDAMWAWTWGNTPEIHQLSSGCPGELGQILGPISASSSLKEPQLSLPSAETVEGSETETVINRPSGCSNVHYIRMREQNKEDCPQTSVREEILQIIQVCQGDSSRKPNNSSCLHLFPLERDTGTSTPTQTETQLLP